MKFLGPYLVACMLLAVAGTAKTLRPHSTARALAALGGATFRLGWVSAAVRVGALFEATLGVVGAIALTRFPAALVCISYTGFTVFVLCARRKGAALSSCGCFSEPDSPPTLLHALLTVGFAASALGVAASGSTTVLGPYLARQPLHGAPFLLVCGIGTWLSYLVIVALPRLGLLRPAVLPHSKSQGEPNDLGP
jgi:methylamine utilization protein MauE